MSQDNRGATYSRSFLVTVLLIGIFCAVLNQTLLFTAQPTLMKAFRVGTSEVQWLSTIYPLVIGVLMPLTAWLADNINTKKLMLTAYAIFFVGTLLCTFAGSFAMMLAGRVVQAIGGGMIQGITMTILFNVYDQSERGIITTLTGIAFGLAPAIGPTLSGWLIQVSSWRLVFGILLPFEALVFILGFFALKPVIPRRPMKLDWHSVILSTFGFTLLLYGLSLAGSVGWFTSKVIWPSLIGSVIVIWFCFRQTQIDDPVLNLVPFKTGQYTLNLSIYAIGQLVMTGTQFLLPLYLQDVHLLTPMQSGMSMIVGALAMGIMSAVSGRLVNRGYGRQGIITGTLLLTIGVLGFVKITATTAIWLIVIIYTVVNIGLSLVAMPSQTVAINALPDRLISHGNAAMSMVRQLATSLGLSIMVSVMQTVIAHQAKPKAVGSQLAGYHAAFWFAVIMGIFAFGLALHITKPKPATDEA